VIVSLPKTVRRMYFLIMFVLLSYLLYHAMSLIGEWLSPIKGQEIPEGTAVRAFHDAHSGNDVMTAGERLRFYYWYGE
jgi:hypothetical protein